VGAGFLGPPQVRPCRLVVQHPCRTRSCRPTPTDPLTIGWGARENGGGAPSLIVLACGLRAEGEPAAVEGASTRYSGVSLDVIEHNGGTCSPIWPVLVSTFEAAADAAEQQLPLTLLFPCKPAHSQAPQPRALKQQRSKALRLSSPDALERPSHHPSTATFAGSGSTCPHASHVRNANDE